MELLSFLKGHWRQETPEAFVHTLELEWIHLPFASRSLGKQSQHAARFECCPTPTWHFFSAEHSAGCWSRSRRWDNLLEWFDWMLRILCQPSCFANLLCFPCFAILAVAIHYVIIYMYFLYNLNDSFLLCCIICIAFAFISSSDSGIATKHFWQRALTALQTCRRRRSLRCISCSRKWWVRAFAQWAVLTFQEDTEI